MSPVELLGSTAKSSDPGTTLRQSPRRLGVWLTLLVLLSFAVRIAAWAYWGTGTIESEGAEYARIAENLRHGVGYVGLVTPGAQLNFNPLFPLLIAAVSLVTHNYEMAGRVVALIMGALLPLPVFGVASRLFNRRVGFIAAILALLHPLLLNLSFTVFSEGPYATLFLCATYVVVVALGQSSPRIWMLVGAAFGLTWLLRAEASAAFAIAVLFALVATEGSWTIRRKRAAAAVATFLLCALPVIIFIYRSTGEVRLEVKSQIFFYTGKRILAAERNPGVDYESQGGYHEVPSPEPNVESWQRWQDKWAFYGIDSNVKGMGFPLRRHREIIQEINIRPKDMLILVARGARENAPMLFQRLSADWIGAPFLTALAMLGAVRRPWRGPQATSRLFVVVVMAAPVMATFFALWNETRYYFVLVPLLSIWAANGLFEIGQWARASAIAAGWRLLARPVVAQCIVPGFVGIMLLVSPVKGVRRNYLFTDSGPSTRVDKEVGEWIEHLQNRSVKIIDLSIPLAFHADAQFSYFPYCTGDLALRYLDAAQVDYVVLRRDQKFTHYYDDWLMHGIPDARAELLQAPSIAGADKFAIYRWHRSEHASGAPNDIEIGAVGKTPHGATNGQ
jgi:4-amino-4-deoxy-L-arabinose transferase-like glycosyltransferase